MFLAAGGVLYGAVKDDIDIGTWHMTPEEQFCRTWHVGDGHRKRCYAMYREGETFTLELQDRWGQEVLRRVPGNPEGY